MTTGACGRCGRTGKIRARGLCGSCYNRIARYGDTAPPKVRRSAEENYAAIDRTAPGCWPWPGSRHSHGYGVVIHPDHSVEMAHRWVYKREGGTLPEDMTLDHVDCETKACVRFDHLEVVTRGENLRRAVGDRTKQVRRLGRCPHSGEDVYVDPTGKRVCRICRRERTRLWRMERQQRLGHY